MPRTPGAASVPYATDTRPPCDVPATTMREASTYDCCDM